MKKYTVVFVLLLLVHYSFSQKQSNVWYFGSDGAGLDFNSCNPTVLTNGWNDMQNAMFEGSTTICDANGQMLFYSNGTSVFNANHVYMQNGNAVLGQHTNTMSQNIIIPFPGSTSLYYLFSPQYQTIGSGSLMYSVIDMTLDNGLGGVTSFGNILRDTLFKRSSEKLTAVKHVNGIDVWLIGHDYYSNKLFSYLITSIGIDSTAIETNIGPIITDPINQSHFDAVGEMKVSPDGSKIGFTSNETGVTAVFNFNTSTGVVSNPITLSLYNGGIRTSGYGVSFSPDNLKFYVTAVKLDSSGHRRVNLHQFDLSVWDSISINNSRQIIFDSLVGDKLYSLKLGPDKKMYVAKSTGASYLGVINYPNILGTACNYVHNGIYLNGLKTTWGLNNSLEMFDVCTTTDAKQNNSISNQIKIYPNPFYQYASLTFNNPTKLGCVLYVYDTYGKLVFTHTNIIDDTFVIDRNNLDNGLYFIVIRSENHIIATSKVVVE